MREALKSGNVFCKNRIGVTGLGILSVFILTAIFAPFLAPYDPCEMFEPMAPPDSQHVLGTNDIGQDIWSELIYASRISLFIAFTTSIIATFIGTLSGLFSGYYERFGFFVMRVVDLFLALPRIPLIIILAVFMPTSIWNLIIIFVLFGWPITTRIIRSEVLTLRTRPYIDSERMMGAGDLYILGRHILPNIFPLVVVQFVMEARHVILAEAGLSFLGLGDPTSKSWGMMLHYAFEYPTIFISEVWKWWMLPPGLCIVVVILALVFVGFALEEILNPRLRREIV